MLNIKAILLIFFFAFLFTSINLNAQSPNFKHFSVEDGIPSSECYQVLQDKKGFIWIATDKGVAKFDGAKFKIYTKEDGLPENCIIRIYEDPTGRIWFAGVTNKIAYFDNNKIRSLKINDELSRLGNNGYINSLQFYKNQLWIGMYGTYLMPKVSFYKGDTKNQFHLQKITDLNKNKTIHGGYIYKFDNNKFLQGSTKNTYNQGLINIITAKKTISEKCFILDGFSSGVIRSILFKKKYYLILYESKLYLVNKFNGKTVERFSLKNNLCYHFLDSKNGLWIGTNKEGLLYYPKVDLKKGKPYHFLKNKTISCITEDHEKGYWITTLEDGVYYIKDINFMHYTELSSSKVNAISVNKNSIYAGLDNGNLVIFKNNISTEVSSNFDPLSVNFIRRITPIDNHTIAIGGSTRFCFMNVNNRKIVPFKPNQQDKLYQGLSVSSTANNNEKFWIGNFSNLVELNYENQNNIKTKIHQAPNRIYSVAADKNGIIWLGCAIGLYRFEKGEFTFQGKGSDALSSRINDIQIQNNTIWNSTKDNGITIIRGAKRYDITTKNGLQSNICQSLFLESEKIGWLASNKGVCKITIESWTPFKLNIKYYNINNGLISNEINQIFKKDNTVYIGSNRGVSLFNEKKVKKNNFPPPIYITSLNINNQDTIVKKNYNLPYDKNDISIKYIGLTFKSEGNVEYKYRLLGLDSDWQFTSYSKATFSKLPYGNYTFEVSAKNNDGYWSKNPAKIYIFISPPFWHTWVFRIIAAISFLSSVYFFIKWRINKIEKRAAENAKLYQQTIEMEMKFLSSQMNPHFTFNAMNSIQYYMLENEPEKAQKYLVKYSKLIRKVLENNMKKYVPIKEEIEMLGLYMDIESLRFEIQFYYSINIPNELTEKKIEIPPMIIQPYVENAICHGISNNKKEKGKINLTFENIDDKIKCTIEDNGVGRKKSNELKSKNSKKESLGMLITHQRLQQLQSESEMEIEPEIIDLVDVNGVGCGTKVIVYLPYVSI